MRLRKIIGGPVSAAMLLSVPVLALLALSPWSSASPVNSAIPADSQALVAGGSNASGSGKIEELSDWKYTDKSIKSAKSEKSKKSPKSKKSEKSKKSKPNHPNHPQNPNHPNHPKNGKK